MGSKFFAAVITPRAARVLEYLPVLNSKHYSSYLYTRNAIRHTTNRASISYRHVKVTATKQHLVKGNMNKARRAARPSQNTSANQGLLDQSSPNFCQTFAGSSATFMRAVLSQPSSHPSRNVSAPNEGWICQFCRFDTIATSLERLRITHEHTCVYIS